MSRKQRPEPAPVSDVKLTEITEGAVFRSLPGSGDWSNNLHYVTRVGTSKLRIISVGEGGIDEGYGPEWVSLDELNIDRASIRRLLDSDPDFNAVG